MKIENIIFYFPHRDTGGAQYLFIRYAAELAKEIFKYKIIYIDYPDGFARKQLSGTSVSFIDYYKGVRCQIPSNSLVNFQLDMLPLFDKEIKYDKETTAFKFWYLHITNLRGHIYVHNFCPLLRKERREAGKCIDKLIEEQSIVLLNSGDYIDFIKDFHTGVHNVKTIPLIVPTDQFVKPKEYSKQLSIPLRFCWLGRLDKEKSRNILTYMNELEVINTKTPISLSLIGVGPSIEYLRTEAQQYSFPISFVGEKRDADLDNYIRDNVDIGLASGTSSLEFCLRGVPVIEQWVIPQIYKAGIIKNFTHTYDRHKIDLSITSCKKNITEDAFVNKFNEIINDYYNKSKTSFEYAMSFSPHNGCKKFLEAIRDMENNYDHNMINYILSLSKIINKSKRRMIILSKIKGIITFRFLR